MIIGSLGYKETISTTVWKIGGQWFNAIQPADEQVRGATFFFDRPHVVDDATATELAAFGVGTLTLL